MPILMNFLLNLEWFMGGTTVSLVHSVTLLIVLRSSLQSISSCHHGPLKSYFHTLFIFTSLFLISGCRLAGYCWEYIIPTQYEFKASFNEKNWSCVGNFIWTILKMLPLCQVSKCGIYNCTLLWMIHPHPLIVMLPTSRGGYTCSSL